MNLFRPYENTTSTSATSATTTPPTTSAMTQVRGDTGNPHHINSMAAAATMAAAAMAMARAAALHQHQTGSPPDGLMGHLPLHQQQMASFNQQIVATEGVRSSPISDPGSPPQSPNGINLTRANGNSNADMFDIMPQKAKDLEENIKNKRRRRRGRRHSSQKRGRRL